MTRPCFALASLALAISTPVAGQTIEFSVVDTNNHAVPSEIQFRPSSSAPWELLDQTRPDGTLERQFPCVAGTQFRADPLDGLYTNSRIEPCHTPVRLRVSQRSFAALVGQSTGSLDRETFAVALGRAEVSDNGRTRRGPHALLVDYLTHSGRLTRIQTDAARTALLNQSSNAFTSLDADNDGVVTQGEVEAAAARQLTLPN